MAAALLSLLELAPGTVVTPATRGEAGQFTVNGQRPNTHYFTVDGVSANSGVSGGGTPAESTGGALPGMTAFGSLDGLISLDAREEVRASRRPLRFRSSDACPARKFRSAAAPARTSCMDRSRTASETTGWMPTTGSRTRIRIHAHPCVSTISRPLSGARSGAIVRSFSSPMKACGCGNLSFGSCPSRRWPPETTRSLGRSPC